MKKIVITEICDKCNEERPTTEIEIDNKVYDFCVPCQNELKDSIKNKGKKSKDAEEEYIKRLKKLVPKPDPIVWPPYCPRPHRDDYFPGPIWISPLLNDPYKITYQNDNSYHDGHTVTASSGYVQERL